jgi:hypothetical protein
MTDLIITAAELADYALTPDDVRRLDPQPVEYTAIDGGPCWLREDLAGLLAARGGEP